MILSSVSAPNIEDELRRLLPELWRVRDGSLWLLLLWHEPHERDGVPEALPDRRHQHPEDDTER